MAYSLGNFCFTPGVGYYVDGAMADYSVILNVTIMDKKISDYDYLFCKSVLVDGKKNNVRVVPVERKMDNDIFARLEKRIKVLEKF